MGLLNKLFGKNNNPAPSHNEDWDFYFTNVDDKLSSISVDLGLDAIAPIPGQTYVAWVSIRMNNPREDGLSSNEEFEILGNVEDDLVKALKSKHSATYCGRLTSDGARDIYFYLSDPSAFEKNVSEAMSKWPQYQFASGSKADEPWSGYREFLYPLPQQLQSIKNRRVIEALEKEGDTLQKERTVFHWIYFKSKTDRDAFWNKIKDDGYNIVNTNDQSQGESPYCLEISRVDKVDHQSVDGYIIPLWKLATESNGDYDGWETSVEK